MNSRAACCCPPRAAHQSRLLPLRLLRRRLFLPRSRSPHRRLLLQRRRRLLRRKPSRRLKLRTACCRLRHRLLPPATAVCCAPSTRNARAAVCRCLTLPATNRHRVSGVAGSAAVDHQCIHRQLPLHHHYLQSPSKRSIFYHGLHLSYDEWLGAKYLLKRTEENIQKQKELKDKHSVEKNTKPGRLSHDKTKSPSGVRGKKRKHEIIKKEESSVSLEKHVNIQIPSSLKKQLVDDHECITHRGQLVKLPRSPSAFEILNKYIDYQVKKDEMIMETVKEIVDGLRCYFDKALPAMLLYKEERQQYKEVVADNVSPSGVYGAEHLLRLFVKLPEMLSLAHIETETMSELQQRLLDFLRFLQSNQSEFFDSNSEKWEGFVNGVKEEK